MKKPATTKKVAAKIPRKSPQVKFKPVFTMGLPAEVTTEGLLKLQKELQGKMDDYHVIVYRHYNEDIKFNALLCDELKTIAFVKREMKKLFEEVMS